MPITTYLTFKDNKPYVVVGEVPEKCKTARQMESFGCGSDCFCDNEREKALSNKIPIAEESMEEAYEALEPVLKPIRERLAKETQMGESYIACYWLDVKALKENELYPLDESVSVEIEERYLEHVAVRYDNVKRRVAILKPKQ